MKIDYRMKRVVAHYYSQTYFSDTLLGFPFHIPDFSDINFWKNWVLSFPNTKTYARLLINCQSGNSIKSANEHKKILDHFAELVKQESLKMVQAEVVSEQHASPKLCEKAAEEMKGKTIQYIDCDENGVLTEKEFICE